MRAMDAAAAAGVPRFSFVSVADYKLPAGWRAQDFLLRGYFQGKRDAEAHMAALFPAGRHERQQLQPAAPPIAVLPRPMRPPLGALHHRHHRCTHI